MASAPPKTPAAISRPALDQSVLGRSARGGNGEIGRTDDGGGGAAGAASRRAGRLRGGADATASGGGAAAAGVEAEDGESAAGAASTAAAGGGVLAYRRNRRGHGLGGRFRRGGLGGEIDGHRRPRLAAGRLPGRLAPPLLGLGFTHPGFLGEHRPLGHRSTADRYQASYEGPAAAISARMPSKSGRSATFTTVDNARSGSPIRSERA